ncbi:MAG: hypothetical protein K8R79_01425 [Calditrichales bacterium]|nr:hypothetical protein [Calditrichales bacterium]
MDLGEPELNLSKIDLFYFKKMVDLCKENHIAVYLLTSPMYNYDYYYSKKYPKFEKHLKSICRNMDLPHFDFLNNKDTEESVYFNNIIHLNREGSIKYSKSLGLLIKSIFMPAA